KIKIDKSFVMDITANEEGRTIVSAIVSMAKSLNLNIIAEGIETREQLLFLKSIGCFGGQGYLFSKPLSYDNFRDFVMRGSDIII
ncbi:MAG: EAL domain-containing protein, partial [Candidatus Magnetoovum sp. WYHC-5]|nr:EAL domain-containing protein [Candidatus Magnetoovum sp. WYHC-5]